MTDWRARRLEREAEMEPLAAAVALAVRDRGREVLLPAPVLGCPTCSGPLGSWPWVWRVRYWTDDTGQRGREVHAFGCYCVIPLHSGRPSVRGLPGTATLARELVTGALVLAVPWEGPWGWWRP